MRAKLQEEAIIITEIRLMPLVYYEVKTPVDFTLSKETINSGYIQQR